jgi:hypothetical protein
MTLEEAMERLRRAELLVQYIEFRQRFHPGLWPDVQRAIAAWRKNQDWEELC